MGQKEIFVWHSSREMEDNHTGSSDVEGQMKTSQKSETKNRFLMKTKMKNY